MQKRLKGLLKILKSHEHLQKSVLKMNEDNLNNFRNSLEFSKNSLKSFKNILKKEIELKNFNKDLKEDQLKVKWVWLGPEEVQQRLSQHIIYNYA